MLAQPLVHRGRCILKEPGQPVQRIGGLFLPDGRVFGCLFAGLALQLLRFGGDLVAGARLRRTGVRAVAKLDVGGRGSCGRGSRLWRSEEHTSELQSLMRTSDAVFCLNKKKRKERKETRTHRI